MMTKEVERYLRIFIIMFAIFGSIVLSILLFPYIGAWTIIVCPIIGWFTWLFSIVLAGDDD